MPPILTLSFRRLAPFAETLAVTALTTAAGFVILEHVEVPNISLVFVIPVLAAAVRHGLAASLWATALSVLAYDYFFLLPLYHFTIADPADVVALVFLTIIALVASGLAARMHGQARKARREARVTSELYDLSAKIAGVLELDDLLWIAVTHLARAVDSEIVVLMPSNGRLVSRAAFPPDSELDRADVAAAQRCWDYDHRTGGVNDTVTPSPRFFLPVHTGRSEIGVIGVLPHDPSGRLQEGDRELLEAVCSQLAVAIERVTLARDVEQARLRAEQERIRSSMLTSVSHDLRTPLASIIGALSSVRSYGERYDEATRADLLATAQSEAERLDRFVGNLLDMTRLDAGVVEPRREPVELGDLVSTTLRRAVPLLQGRTVATSVPADLPAVSLDFVLAEQVLFNLLDNAAKYSPAGGRIEVAARAGEGKTVEIVVRDEGPGIPPDAIGRLFDKFYRAGAVDGDRRRPGTGLGLAIARGFVEAMGGTIAARNRTDRSGAEFVLGFPA
jgi:two-component system sensor histidine kinase KdpD